jgi:hypothetical protein
MQVSQIIHKIFNDLSPDTFESLAIDIFQYQAKSNIVYNNYIKALKIAPESIDNLEKIPFLPIEFFKTHSIKTGEFSDNVIFTSSGTSGTATSRHHVKDIEIYKKSFLKSFHKFYGDPAGYVIYGLLPSYLERTGSSLILMVDELIRQSGNADSGFFLDDHQSLAKKLLENEKNGKKNLLIGVTFALLRFAEEYPMALKNTIIMETGGMKGRGEEIIREQLQSRLSNAFECKNIHSEYGMTELLSQAYSNNNGIFECPPWMSVRVRETTDPLSHTKAGKGALNIIDLANIYSCAFIATQDLGFEVSGRFDHADIRGCNLLVL